MKTRKQLRGLLFAIMAVCVTLYPAVADDDDHHGRDRQRDHERHEFEQHHQKHLRPVDNQTYKDQCGACHFAYLPELLPTASWIKIMNALDNHFGEDVLIDAVSKKEISDYLQSDAAEKTRAKQAYKIMESLGDLAPDRIRDIPYIKKKHMGIPPDFLSNKTVGSISNCIACHTTADKGVFDDEQVKIPR